jgi:hypothetical protein
MASRRMACGSGSVIRRCLLNVRFAPPPESGRTADCHDRTHALQQTTCTGCNNLLHYLAGMNDKPLARPDHSWRSEIPHRPACAYCISRFCCGCRNAILSVMPQQPAYERHERRGRKTTKPQAETRKCPAKFAGGENLRGTDAVRRNARCDPACAPAFDPDEIQ